MREVEVSIDKLANGGAGFGRHNGKALFVPFTAPGDLARVQITAARSSYDEGRLLELITPSHHRINPVCPIFGLCGGCNWQHIDYSTQLTAKEQILSELLWRSARIPPECVLPTAPAQTVYGYRSRIQLKIGPDREGCKLGFFLPKSHEIIGLPETCAITHHDINKSVAALPRLICNYPEIKGIRQVDVARGDDGKTCAIIHCSSALGPASLKYLSHVEPFADAVFIRCNGKTTRVSGDGGNLWYTIPEDLVPGLPKILISFSKGAFSQINYSQNLKLIQSVTEFAELTGKERVLDLYCGNGNFSLPLAIFASHVTGVEGFGPSIEDAKRNAAHNNIRNISFYAGDAIVEVKKLIADGKTFDIIVLDPPRQGAPEAVQLIASFKPQKIIYVSCDQATLARDLSILQKNGFDIIKCQGIDMFPQTYHLESVTLLTRN